MKICIDLTSLSYHISGIERFALCITKEMLEIDKENEYILVFRNKTYSVLEQYIDDKRVKTKILYGNNKLLFLQVSLCYELYRIKADFYVFFAFCSPILFRKKNQYNTIHDMGCWDADSAMTLLQKVYIRMQYKHATRKSVSILTVSQFSKGRIGSILNYPLDNVYVLYNGISDVFLRKRDDSQFDSIRERYKLPTKYILYLSTLEPRKNLQLLLEAFNEVALEVDYELVLVGRTGWKIKDLLCKYENAKKINITGYVEDEDVALIYKNAKCFIFPSLYEGFGIPPLEALASGTPVISSDAASMPEILMNQVKYFGSGNKQDLVNILRNLDNEISNLPTSWNEKQKKLFSYKESALRVLHILENK